MPPRSLLSSEQRTRLFAIPSDSAEMVRHYVLGGEDLALIRTKRRSINRLGFAVQLCLLRHPGLGMGPAEQPPEAMIAFVADQLGVPGVDFADYAQRDQTRREHVVELQRYLSLRSFGLADWRACLRVGTDAAWATDRGGPIVLAMLAHLRANSVRLPATAVLERIGLAARARARKKTFETLAVGRSDTERDTLKGCSRSIPSCAVPASPGSGIIRSHPRHPTSSRCWIVSNMRAGSELTRRAPDESTPPGSPG